MASPPVSNNITTTTMSSNLAHSDAEWTVINQGLVILAVTIIPAIIILIVVVFLLTLRKSEKVENFSDNNAFGRGLRNLGNTCYFNAAIQCLVSTPILKSQVERVGGLTKEYLTFLEPIDPENGSVSTSLNPQSLLDAFREKVPRFREFQQHDCHELLRNFLDQMRKEERDMYPSKKLTAVDRIFGGHFMTIYICKECKTPYHVCEPFLDISVPICRGDESEWEHSDQRPQKTIIEAESATPYQEAVELIMERLHLGTVDLPDKILSIKDSLQYFTRQEMLGLQYLCKSCTSDSVRSNPEWKEDHRATSATKQTLIFNPPAVLVIHLKRFEMKSSGFEKRTNKVKFEEVLDLGPYCSSWCQRNEDREQNIWYSLYAVVVHSGSLTSGHYETYVKERTGDTDCENFLQKEYLERDMTADELIELTKGMYRKGRASISTKYIASQGSWYCLNDSSVSRVSVEEVLKKEAFLLFYERVSPIGWLK